MEGNFKHQAPVLSGAVESLNGFSFSRFDYARRSVHTVMQGKEFQSKIQEIKSIEVKSDNTHNSNKKELNSNKEINEIKENNNQEKIYVIINKNNLKILTQSFESYEDKYKLINTKSKENKENKDINKKNNKNGNEDGDINNNTDRIYCNSITNIEMELPL